MFSSHFSFSLSLISARYLDSQKKVMRRKFLADEVMHVYQRTVSGFNIFYSSEDFLVFFTIVSVYVRRYGIILMGLCQMIDHIHLLCYARSLSDMSRFISAYTSRFVKEFNSRIGRTGKLFVKEYGSAIKKESKRIRSAIAYLFNNPVEKMLCGRAEEYRWNYLKYYAEINLKSIRYCTSGLQKSVRIVKEAFKNGKYLNYRLIDSIFKELDKEEREYLIDSIIKLYFPFDIKEVTKYYRSYEDMLTAINSNTGNEYDIHEQYYGKTDVAYREMITYLKNSGIEDVRSVITICEDDKRRLAALLKSGTSATSMQIRKFLHICP